MPAYLDNGAIFWMIVIIGAVAIEAGTLVLTAIWFACGGVAALVFASLGFGLLPQLTIFTIVSALLLLAVRPFTKRFLKPKGAKTNADRIIGEQALVTIGIDNAMSQGEIHLMGQTWTARSADGSPIAKGEKVRVLEIVGVKAVVEKI